MINKNKVYIINMNDLSQVKSFPVYRGTSEEIASYLIGRRIDLHLLCCIDHASIILRYSSYNDMIREIQYWMEAPTPYYETKEFNIPQEMCPYCKSDNISNEGPPNDFNMLEVDCFSCGRKWTEPANFLSDILKQRDDFTKDS